MTLSCVRPVPGGRVACIKALERATHFGLIELDNNFSTFDLAENLNTWRVMLQETMKMTIFNKVHNFENSTSDPTMSEPEISKVKLITDVSPLSYVFYLQSNFCDYKVILSAMKPNTNYMVVYFLADGTPMLVDGLDGTVDGFQALCSAVSKGSVKEMADAFPVYVNHINYEDMQNAVLLDVEWTVNDLLGYIPEGTGMRAVGKYNTTAGTIVVDVFDRCDAGLGSLTDADFEVVRSNVSTPAITTVAAVAGVTGRYTFTLDKESTPESLEVGDTIVIRQKTATGSIVSKVSQELAIIVKETTV